MSTSINSEFYHAYYEDRYEEIALDIAIFRKLIRRTPWWKPGQKRKLQRVLDDLLALCPTSDRPEGLR